MTAAIVREFACTPDDVFAVLGDGWLYPVWVVGAGRMRDVTPEWPEEGSKIHHSIGIWPILLDDASEIVEWSPPERLRLRAKIGPFGRGVVVIDVKARGDRCVVRMAEEPTGGPASLLPELLWRPALHLRNRETMKRLQYLCEGRRREREAGEESAREDVPSPPEGTPGPEAAADAARAEDPDEAGREGGST